MRSFPTLAALALLVAAGCGGGSGGGSTPPPPVTPTPTPTSSSPTPSPTPTSGQPLSGSYTTSYQTIGATPIPATVPIQLFGQNQIAVISLSGGIAPYGGTLQFCTSGSGFGAPFTLVQSSVSSVFTLTATQFAGSCTVTLFDASTITRTLQIQASLTTTAGMIQ